MIKILRFSFVMLLVQFFIYFSAFAQIVISGKIANQTHPLPNAIITLNNYHTEVPLAYALSKPNGQFELRANSNSFLQSDSLTLIVKLLGYEEQRINILNKSQVINFYLEEASIALKEVKVRQQAIRKYGDTLSYAVSAFKDKNDRVIADIIRKLPGIEVNPNGQILYQGEPINKYYIEGMDLLEGRYKLANDNLNVEAVTDIEILENHQPIRLLNSVVFSEKAALNIKLKKSITTTGQMSIGGGFKPILWDCNLTPMLFTKKMQFLGTYQTNNVGRNVSNQLMRLTPGIYDGELNLENKQDWLGIQQLSSPPFNENRWLNNNSHIGSLNMLKKTKNSTDLRLIVDYCNDVQKQEGTTKTLFFTSREDSVMLLENKTNQLFFNNLKADFTIQKNNKEKYLKNSLKFKAYWDKQIGIVDNTNNVLKQQSSNPFFTVSNEYKNLFRFRKYLLTLNSNIVFEKKPQTLLVKSKQFVGFFNEKQPFETLQQEVLQTSFFTNNSIQFLKIIKLFAFDTQAGFVFEKQSLTSDITIEDSDKSNKIGGEFSNNLAWLKQKYYVNLECRYKKGKLNINLDTPINFYVYRIQDDILGKEEKLNKSTVEPQLGIHYELNNFWTLSLSSEKNNNFGNINQLHYGYIMNSYRNVNRANTPLSQAIKLSNSLILSYRNPINSTFGNIIYNHTKSINKLLFVNTISQNGVIEQNAIEDKNNSYSQMLNGNIGKYFREIKTNIAIGNSIIEQSSLQIINNQLSEIVSRNITPTLRVSLSPLNWFGLSYNYKLSTIKNIISGVSKPNIIQQTHEIKLDFNSKSDCYFGIKSDFYANNFSKNSTLFLDLVFRKTTNWHTKKIDLEANLVNIFNTKTFTNLINDNFYYVTTTYNLRPSQFIFSIKAPF